LCVFLMVNEICSANLIVISTRNQQQVLKSVKTKKPRCGAVVTNKVLIRF